MTESLLPRRDPEEFMAGTPGAISREIHREAEVIVERVRAVGEAAIREYATRFDERTPEQLLETRYQRLMSFGIQ